MNEPRFEVFPEMSDAEQVPATVNGAVVPYEKVPTGQFVWHFQDANGKIAHIGGEAFGRREDAHRSIVGTAYDYAKLLGLKLDPGKRKALVDSLPIVDLDENGEVMTS